MCTKPALPSSRSIPFGPLVAVRRDETVFVARVPRVDGVRDERRTDVLTARTVAGGARERSAVQVSSPFEYAAKNTRLRSGLLATTLELLITAHFLWITLCELCIKLLNSGGYARNIDA